MTAPVDSLPSARSDFEGEIDCPWCLSESIQDATLSLRDVLDWLAAAFLVDYEAVPPVNDDGTAECRHPVVTCPHCHKPSVLSAKAYVAEPGSFAAYCQAQLHPCRTAKDIELAQRQQT